MYDSLHLELGAHTHPCILVAMDPSGHVVSTQAFSTSEVALIRYLTKLPVRSKRMALEECLLARLFRRCARMSLNGSFVILGVVSPSVVETSMIAETPLAFANCFNREK